MQYHQYAKRIRSEVPPCCQKHNYCTCKLFLWIRGAAGSYCWEEWLLLMQECQSPFHGFVCSSQGNSSCPGGLLTLSVLTWQTGAYGCLLMLCCSYVLSGLMVPRGSGGFAWRGGKEGPAEDELHPWEVECPEISVVCHKSDWILGNDWQTLSKQCLIRDQEMVNAYTAS